MSSTRVYHSRLVATLLAVAWLIPPLVPAVQATGNMPAGPELQSVTITGGGIRLATNAGSAPLGFERFRRFGLFDSTPVALAPFNRLTVNYRRLVPLGTETRVDVRARGAAGWSEWQLGVADGAEVTWDTPMVDAQYRVSLLSNSSASPTVSVVAFESPALDTGVDTAAKLAPTYRLRVTRQGMVGRRTANGHTITRNDVFVSLPSWKSLSSRGGKEYQVRLSANGHSIVAPVMDVGPWNHHDNYWNPKRERNGDLPTGWPQDHAAYYENHNGGRAELGYVRFPSAVDIGDGAYWALGLGGAQATVDVTFLWIGKDPGPNPEPLNPRPSVRPSGEPPAAREPEPEPTPEPQPTAAPTPVPEQPVVVDDVNPGFVAEGSNWPLELRDCAFGGQARWAPATGTPDATHQAVWRPALGGGTYDVQAFVPACAANESADSVEYIVQPAGPAASVTVNQAASAGQWVSLGRFQFAPGESGYVQLRNNGAREGARIWFDAVRLLPTAP